MEALQDAVDEGLGLCLAALFDRLRPEAARRAYMASGRRQAAGPVHL